MVVDEARQTASGPLADRAPAGASNADQSDANIAGSAPARAGWRSLGHLATEELARAATRRPDAAGLGRQLARRLAEHVYVEDQGRDLARNRVPRRPRLDGPSQGSGDALLSSSLGQSMSATRDQVLDALWPELDPEIAVNSLNQTIYFLRTSARRGTIRTTSRQATSTTTLMWCGLILNLFQAEPWNAGSSFDEFPDAARARTTWRGLTLLYRGRFALDFEYEEWAAAYRDNLHATYLEIVERSVLDDFTSGHYDRGITVARRASDSRSDGGANRGLPPSPVPCHRGAFRGGGAVRSLRSRDARGDWSRTSTARDVLGDR